MTNNKTRTFDATYTDKNGEAHKLKVRVNTRLVSLFLALTLVASTSACSIKNNKKGEENPKNTIEIDYQSDDLKQIEEIIMNHPEMISTKEVVKHTVQYGESLSVIAEEYGTTVDKIKEMNPDLLKSDILQMGLDLSIEKNNNLQEIDASINILETYVFDYVLGSSSVSRIANSDNENDRQRNVYRNAIYGNEKDNEIDTHSIYGHAIRAYATFHDENIEATSERKETYLNALRGIVREIEEKLNLSGNAQIVIPFSEYETYCKNRSTKYQVEYTPYGNRIS